jgi:putative Mg2+ transporter-C (MgtC) family protein
MGSIVHGNELAFALRLGLCLVFGAAIGVERELRNKPAGISTMCFVMGGSCLFTFMSVSVDHDSPARIAAQVVSGVGFLGAGIILRGEGNTVKNLTTAAAVWVSAAIGMAIGFGWYLIAGICTVYSVVVPRLPQLRKTVEQRQDE